MTSTYELRNQALDLGEAVRQAKDEYNKILANITKEIPQVIYTTKDYAEIRSISMSTYEEILNNNADIEKTLQNAADQISSSTGRKIAK